MTEVSYFMKQKFCSESGRFSDGQENSPHFMEPEDTLALNKERPT
jgi:hypothetical protein